MELHFQFLILGGLLFIGTLANEIGRRTPLPRVSLMILFGVLIGSSGFDLLPDEFQDWYKFLASAALTMIAFILGGKLSQTTLMRHGRTIFIVSVAAVTLTALIVGLGLLALGTSMVMVLILAATSTATAPAATHDVVRQLRSRGPFTETLLGIVAIDDAWGLLAFSFLLMSAKAISGNGDGSDLILHALWEFGGAATVGALVGFPAAYLTGRLHPGEPVQSEVLSLVFLCAGLAIWFDVSFLLAGIIAGAIVVNFAKHHDRAFHEIENVEWPFMVLFFVLAGASLDVSTLPEIGMIGLVYLLLRTFGRIVGGWAGASFTDMPPTHRRWIGTALVPQAGVALGMALVAANEIPEIADQLLAVVVGTTILFETFGPVLTALALYKVKESGSSSVD